MIWSWCRSRACHVRDTVQGNPKKPWSEVSRQVASVTSYLIARAHTVWDVHSDDVLIALEGQGQLAHLTLLDIFMPPDESLASQRNFWVEMNRSHTSKAKAEHLEASARRTLGNPTKNKSKSKDKQHSACFLSSWLWPLTPLVAYVLDCACSVLSVPTEKKRNRLAWHCQRLALLFLFHVLWPSLSAVGEVFVFEMFNGYALGHAYISTP